MNQELLGSESLVQENARLHERIIELSRPELAAIDEYSAAEEHVRTLESEVYSKLHP